MWDKPGLRLGATSLETAPLKKLTKPVRWSMWIVSLPQLQRGTKFLEVHTVVIELPSRNSKGPSKNIMALW